LSDPDLVKEIVADEDAFVDRSLIFRYTIDDHLSWGPPDPAKFSSSAPRRKVHVQAVLAFLTRKKGTTKEQFMDYYENVHSKMGWKYLPPNGTRYERRYITPVRHPMKTDQPAPSCIRLRGRRVVRERGGLP